MSRMPPPPPPPPPSSGNTNVGGAVQVMGLNATSQHDRQQHQLHLLELEAKQRATRVDVPTLPHDVRTGLRQLGQPVRLFGESLADVRNRLRLVIARRELLQEYGYLPDSGQLAPDGAASHSGATAAAAAAQEEEEKVTKYSRATPELIEARNAIATFSLQRAQERLGAERDYRVQWQRKRARLAEGLKEDISVGKDGHESNGEESETLVDRIDDECRKCYKTLRNIGLEGSQYGDARPISSICTSQRNFVAGIPLVATGSWSGTIKLWDGSSSELALIGQTKMAHQDRIMGIASNIKEKSDDMNDNVDSMLLATASIDLTAKLWKVERSDAVMEDVANENTETGEGQFDQKSSKMSYSIREVAHLQGHAARLCRTAFHPLGNYLATTSFDHTWRLWDIESGGKEILLQDGHWKEVFGVGFHPDGSMIATTDFGSVVQLWDLRTGKSIHHCLGHARRVLCAEFHPSNGFQLATAGDDGTIKVWDLRQRKQFASVPAHSGLVTKLRFEGAKNEKSGRSSEFLASSSFDGTAKIWSTRDWNLLSTLRGHEGKITGVDILPGVDKRNPGLTTFVTSGFDKTLKLWR